MVAMRYYHIYDRKRPSEAMTFFYHIYYGISYGFGYGISYGYGWLRGQVL